jgi:hypothetical protein
MKPALKQGERAEDRRRTSDAREATFVDIPQCLCSHLVQLVSRSIIVYGVWTTETPLVSVPWQEVFRVAVTVVFLHGNRLISI